MKNTLILKDDQINTLLDLVNDQIRAQRVYLRSTPLNKTYIAGLTHFRNLKRLLIAKEREILRDMSAEMDHAENMILFETFSNI
jgi:hypothetical protein